MAKKKFYAIKSDTKNQIFTTWDECKEALKDPSFSGNKSYKGFVTKDEANAFISNADANPHGIYQQDLLDENATYIYVDGSHSKERNKIGSGVVVVKNFKIIDEISIRVTNPEFSQSWQIGGEVCAAVTAIEYAIQNNINNIVIAYDYAGLEGWAPEGWGQDWKRNTVVAQAYRKRLDELKAQNPNLNVKFTKVSSSHSSNAFNDKADELAKKGTL